MLLKSGLLGGFTRIDIIIRAFGMIFNSLPN